MLRLVSSLLAACTALAGSAIAQDCACPVRLGTPSCSCETLPRASFVEVGTQTPRLACASAGCEGDAGVCSTKRTWDLFMARHVAPCPVTGCAPVAPLARSASCATPKCNSTCASTSCTTPTSSAPCSVSSEGTCGTKSASAVTPLRQLVDGLVRLNTRSPRPSSGWVHGTPCEPTIRQASLSTPPVPSTPTVVNTPPVQGTPTVQGTPIVLSTPPVTDLPTGNPAR